MPCSLSCSLATIAIICMVYFNNATTQSQVVKHYKSQLSPNLQQLYEKISNERLRIYYYGYILGFILSFIVILYNYQKKTKQNMISIICTVIAVSFVTNYFYYILSPKTDWMLNHIHTSEENKAWLEMYRSMQKYYHIGLVLGIIAVALFAFAFRC